MTAATEEATSAPPPAVAGPPVVGAPRPARRQCAAIIAVLWVTAGAAALPYLVGHGPINPPAPIRTGVDPNSAPWWELSALPEVGESTAREIVRHRAALQATRAREGLTGPVFQTAADLDQVKGIGPVTILRMSPHLRFAGGPP